MECRGKFTVSKVFERSRNIPIACFYEQQLKKSYRNQFAQVIVTSKYIQLVFLPCYGGAVLNIQHV